MIYISRFSKFTKKYAKKNHIIVLPFPKEITETEKSKKEEIHTVERVPCEPAALQHFLTTT